MRAFLRLSNDVSAVVEFFLLVVPTYFVAMSALRYDAPGLHFFDSPILILGTFGNRIRGKRTIYSFGEGRTGEAASVEDCSVAPDMDTWRKLSACRCFSWVRCSHMRSWRISSHAWSDKRCVSQRNSGKRERMLATCAC